MRTDEDGRTGRRLPSVRLGMAAGLVGMLCCVGPTVLALFGVVGAATAYGWATRLYDGYAWWFRLGGLVVLAALVVWTLRRRRACSVAGARSRWRGLVVAMIAAVVTYGVLYAVTAALGGLA